MKRHDLLINLGLVGLLWFCLAFSCSNEPTSHSTTDEPATTTSRDTSTETSADAPEISGTYWSFISMTKRGEAVRETQNPPDFEFCKTGEWGLLHYGGAREAGSYQVRGNRMVMKNEDGTLYGDYRMSQSGNILTLDDGEYVLRLRADGKAGC
jgi:hypothetical protein